MKLLKLSQTRSKSERGFTLIEVMVVIGLVALLAMGSYMISISSFQRYAFASERDILVNLLHKARSRAVSNVAESGHGLRLEDNEYVLYAICDCIDEIHFPKNPSVEVTPADFDITFTSLSGDSENMEIVLQKGGQEISVSISENGRISW